MLVSKSFVANLEREIALLKEKVEVLEKQNTELRNSARREIEGREDTIKDLKRDMEFLKKTQALEVEAAKNAIRKELEKAAVVSDLSRVAAESELKAYKNMDTKSEREHINKMLENAIAGLSKKTEIVVAKQ